MDNQRLTKLKKLLTQNNLDAALISSLTTIIYLTNFPYFTDVEREVFLLITKTDQYILTDSRYSHAVKIHVKNFELLEISIQTPLIAHLQFITKKKSIKHLGIEEDNLTVAEHKRISSIIKTNKHIDLKPLRITKEKNEIEDIQNSCKIGDKAFSYILKQIRVGMTEKEVAILLENFIRKYNAEPSFPSIVAFGANAAVPHHKTGKTKLKTSDLVLLDFGVKFENYCSDMTRTVFVGKATEEQKNVYQVVKVAQEKAMQQFNNVAIKQSKPVLAHKIDKVARDYIISKGYPSIPHSLGHGIGLQIHEAPSLSPKSDYILTEGMVFSIEPGIYINNKLGVRIEDLFAIQNNKLIRLTKSSRKLIEL